MYETYDLTNLETKVNTTRYIRWHTTFSHNVTSPLSENVVSVPAENSFQPSHSMNMQNKNLKLCTPHIGTPPMYVTCYYPYHRPSDDIASQDGITQHVVLPPGT